MVEEATVDCYNEDEQATARRIDALRLPALEMQARLDRRERHKPTAVTRRIVVERGGPNHDRAGRGTPVGDEPAARSSTGDSRPSRTSLVQISSGM
jgi:hypothetical protein